MSIDKSYAIAGTERPPSTMDGGAVLTRLVHFPNDLQALLGINFNLHSRGIECPVTRLDADISKGRGRGNLVAIQVLEAEKRETEMLEAYERKGAQTGIKRTPVRTPPTKTDDRLDGQGNRER